MEVRAKKEERALKVVNKVTERKIVDVESGEILREEEILQGYGEKEPDYVKMYLKDITALKDLPKGLDKVIYELLKIMHYNNVIVLNAYLKREIANSLGYKSVQVLSNYLGKLVNAGILFKLGTGTYEMNAQYFGRGKWENIKEIRSQQVYTAKGKDIKVEITHEDEES